jgi:phage virion morphogenesis protein
VTIRIDVDNAEVVRSLQTLLATVRSPQKALRKVGFALTELVADSFNQGKDPWGTPWEPLSALTVSRRRRQSAEPLRDIGLLRASVEAQVSDDSVTVSVGRTDRPAQVHQFGNPRNRFYNTPRGNPAPIPARPFLPIRYPDKVELAGTEYEDVLLDVMDAMLAEAAR